MSAQSKAERVVPDPVWAWLDAVADPEIPVLSIVDLGIVRDVRRESTASGETVVVTITPTYSGCPAIDAIRRDIEMALRERGVDVRLETRLAPAWTTDWMSAAAAEKLRRYGIAPPGPCDPSHGRASDAPREHGRGVRDASTDSYRPISFRANTDRRIACPHCGATNTECISAFGSTACKAQYRCRECLEPFDWFKPI